MQVSKPFSEFAPIRRVRNPIRWCGIWFVALIATTTSGCGGGVNYELAPVQGYVWLDGAPLPGARVTFYPNGSKGNIEPGPMSVATTDDQGRFTLRTVDGATGAVVGDHLVTISTRQTKPDPKNSDQVIETHPERVPDSHRKPPGTRVKIPAEGNKELVIRI